MFNLSLGLVLISIFDFQIRVSEILVRFDVICVNFVLVIVIQEFSLFS